MPCFWYISIYFWDSIFNLKLYDSLLDWVIITKLEGMPRWFPGDSGPCGLYWAPVNCLALLYLNICVWKGTSILYPFIPILKHWQTFILSFNSNKTFVLTFATETLSRSWSPTTASLFAFRLTPWWFNINVPSPGRCLCPDGGCCQLFEQIGHSPHSPLCRGPGVTRAPDLSHRPHHQKF